MFIHDLIKTHPLGAFADQSSENETEEIVIPETFSGMADSALAELHEKAEGAFSALYNNGEGLTDEHLEALATLGEGISSIKQERDKRETLAAERVEKAKALAAKVGVTFSTEAEEEGSQDAETEEAEEATSDEEATPEEGTEAVETVEGDLVEKEEEPAKRSTLRITVPASRTAKYLPTAETSQPAKVSDVMFSSESGKGITFEEAAEVVDRRLAGLNVQQFQNAAARGQNINRQMGVLSIRKPISDELKLQNSDPSHIEEVLRRATDEKRLPGNSLVASGGWCAPSETLYDLLELESREGIFSIPEFGMKRGGIKRTLGPDFGTLYNQIEGFRYTEEEDIAGNYDGKGGGSKPCFKVECPDFEEFRLEVSGLCITAGLLQQRAYPEMIARTLRGALIAHEHRMAGLIISEIEKGSTAVSYSTADGVTANLLAAIELQVQHMRYYHRLPQTASMEAIFPFWVRGAIRADLSKRNGVDLINVTDQTIDAWFRTRGVNAQFVYNWQDLNVMSATAMTAFPDTVKFLLYPAGAWVRGSSDIITVDTLFDSTQLGQNDYTALFTEEGYVVVKMSHDSRVISVKIDPSGVTGNQKALTDSTLTLTASPKKAFADSPGKEALTPEAPKDPVVGGGA